MAGDIEFLDPEPPDPDGVAPGDPAPDEHASGAGRQGARRQGARRHAADPSGPRFALASRRARVLAVVAAAAVLAALLIARIGTSGDHAPAAAPAPTPSSSSSYPGGVGQVLDPSTGEVVYCYTIVTIPDHPIPVSGVASGARQTVALPTGDVGPRPEPLSPAVSVAPHQSCATTEPAACPKTHDASDCTSTTTLPDGFLETVDRRFPGARVLTARTFVVSGTHRLWERTVTLAQGYARITIVVGRHGTALGPSSAHDDGSHLQLRAVSENATDDVLVEVTVPSGSSTSLQSVLDFATQNELSAV